MRTAAGRRQRRRPARSTTSIFPATSWRCRRRCRDKRVDYTDGAPTTVDQYAKDVSAFLMWAAEPHLEARKRIGLQVMIFLVVFAGLLYFTKKKVWRDGGIAPANELTPRAPPYRAEIRRDGVKDRAAP